MTRTNNLREAAAAVFSGCVGVALAVSLAAAHWTNPVKPRRVLHVTSTLRVVARAPVAPAQAIAPVLVPIQTKEAPKAPPKAKPLPVPDATKSSATAQQPAVAELPVIESSKSTPLVQPELPPTVTSNDEDLPRLPQAAAVENLGFDKPPAPPDDYVPPEKQYPEQPGGDTLVLGVLVNSNGDVLDSKILVPSRDGLKDITWATVAIRNQHFEVKLPPGQTRWLELRIVMPSPNSLLP